jgi:glycine/D-amino acid oxidase-like deaminating enzyme
MMPVSCELLVAGGGVAGACAAIAAARCGVRTILAERQGQPGGTATAGLLQYLCGLYPTGDELPADTLNNGLTREIASLLMKKAPLKTVRKIGQVYVLPYADDDLREILSSLFDNEKDLTVYYNTTATGVEAVRGTVRGVTVTTPGGTQAIAAAMFIDATGNGDLAALAGAGFELSPEIERQLAGFSIRVDGLVAGDDSLSLKVPYHCARAVERNLLPLPLKFTTFTPGDAPAECYLKMSLSGEDTPDRDRQALENAHALLAYLGQAVPAFSDARISGSSHKVLDREGRRITGEYTLSEEDVLAPRKFPDAIVRNAWPIELWDRTRGTLYRYVSRGDFYEIPFRCITVRGMTNLLTAGRCISVSPAALGSTRVMGACMALGEQAGLAAAFHVRNGKYPLTTMVLP